MNFSPPFHAAKVLARLQLLRRQVEYAQKSQLLYDQPEGRLDYSLLPRIVVSPLTEISYIQEKFSDFPDFLVGFRIGPTADKLRRQTAAWCVDKAAETLQRLSIKTAIFGKKTMKQPWRSNQANFEELCNLPPPGEEELPAFLKAHSYDRVLILFEGGGVTLPSLSLPKEATGVSIPEDVPAEDLPGKFISLLEEVLLPRRG